MFMVYYYDFYFRNVNLSKIINFLHNLGPSEEKLNKISFLYYYKIFYIKKPLVYL